MFSILRTEYNVCWTKLLQMLCLKIALYLENMVLRISILEKMGVINKILTFLAIIYLDIEGKGEHHIKFLYFTKRLPPD